MGRARTTTWILIGSVAALCLGCRQPSDRGEPDAGATTPEAEALAGAEAAAKRLGGRLRERLADALNLGATRAADVCADEAQAIAASVRDETHVAVGRSSLRLRNPADAAPPWVADWLAAQGERRAEGVAPLRVVAATPAGPVARVILPIAIEPTCLGCHGRRDHLAPGVLGVLDRRYPGDRATGYEIGDLRGALWAEAAVRSQP